MHGAYIACTDLQVLARPHLGIGWLELLGLPHFAYRASNMLAPHVGETKTHCGRRSHMPNRGWSTAPVDKVDTFLAERQKQSPGVEVSMVNDYWYRS